MFKVGDEIIAIMDALPINIRQLIDIQICTIPKGTKVKISHVGQSINNTTKISVQLDRQKAAFAPVYWASMFQAVDQVTEVYVYYDINS